MEWSSGNAKYQILVLKFSKKKLSSSQSSCHNNALVIPIKRRTNTAIQVLHLEFEIAKLKLYFPSIFPGMKTEVFLESTTLPISEKRIKSYFFAMIVFNVFFIAAFALMYYLLKFKKKS